MRIDDLTRELHVARDDQPTADLHAGRDAVARAVRRHQTRRVTAIAACVLLLLGAFAVTVTRVGKGDPGYGTSTEGIPKLVPTGLPDGLRIKFLSTRPGELAAFPVDDVHVAVFAKPGAQAPNDGFVVTRVRVGSSTPAPSTPPTSAIDPADVRTDEQGFRWAGRGEPDGTTTIVTSRTLEPAELTAITRALRYLPSGDVDPASIPPPYAPVVTNARSVWLTNMFFATVGSGYVQIYAAPSTSPTGTRPASNPLGSRDETSLSISAQPAVPGDVEVARWMIPGAQPRTVRGHDAVGGSFAMVSTSTATEGAPSGGRSRDTTSDTNLRRTLVGSYNVVVWMENDATLMQLSSANYSIDELARIAEGLQTDPSGFRDLQAATTTTTLAANCTRTADGGSVCRGGSGGGSDPCTTVTPPPTGPAGDQPRASGSIACRGSAIPVPDPATTTAPTSPPATARSATPPG